MEFPNVPAGHSVKLEDWAGQYAPTGHGVGTALPRGQKPPAVQFAGAE